MKITNKTITIIGIIITLYIFFLSPEAIFKSLIRKTGLEENELTDLIKCHSYFDIIQYIYFDKELPEINIPK